MNELLWLALEVAMLAAWWLGLKKWGDASKLAQMGVRGY